MPKALYKIVSPKSGFSRKKNHPFDGQFVEVDTSIPAIKREGAPDLVCIVSLVFPDRQVGDRDLSCPFPLGEFYISMENLQPVGERVPKIFATDNPFGKVRSEGRAKGGNLEVAWCIYEKSIQVTVSEKLNGKNRTRYTNYFFGDNKHISDVITVIQEHTKAGDLDDLIFVLDGMKGAGTIDTEGKGPKING